MGLTFAPRVPPAPLKRGRTAADIDGEHSSMQKKKRRLRLFLITSRLSPQFSHPATNIVDRGSSKIAVWAKQKSLGRNLLRKAAILNRVRRAAISAKQASEGHGRVLIEQEKEQRELELARLEFENGCIDTYTRPVTLKTPSVPPAVAVRSEGRFIVSGSPSVSPESSRSSSPTPSSPPLNGQDRDMSEYRSPNEAYAYSPPRGQLPRRDYIPLPPSPLGISNYDAFDVDEDIPGPFQLDDEVEEEAFTSSFHNDDDDDDTVPFSPSAITTTKLSTTRSQANHMPKTRTFFNSNGTILDHNEPVFGDYDQVDDGADAIWPSSYAEESRQAAISSTSPDFRAIFTTSMSKRIDSFVEPADTRPNLSSFGTSASYSTSPNFPSTTTPASVSPNFTATTSPNFPPSVSPNLNPAPISPNFTPASISPNFAAADAPSLFHNPFSQRRHSLPTQPHPSFLAPEETDMEQERRRQKHLMFMRFGS